MIDPEHGFSGYGFSYDHERVCGSCYRPLGRFSVVTGAVLGENGHNIGGTAYHPECVPAPDHKVHDTAKAIAEAFEADYSQGLDQVVVGDKTVNFLDLARRVLKIAR